MSDELNERWQRVRCCPPTRGSARRPSGRRPPPVRAADPGRLGAGWPAHKQYREGQRAAIGNGYRGQRGRGDTRRILGKTKMRLKWPFQPSGFRRGAKCCMAAPRRDDFCQKAYQVVGLGGVGLQGGRGVSAVSLQLQLTVVPRGSSCPCGAPVGRRGSRPCRSRRAGRARPWRWRSRRSGRAGPSSQTKGPDHKPAGEKRLSSNGRAVAGAELM